MRKSDEARPQSVEPGPVSHRSSQDGRRSLWIFATLTYVVGVLVFAGFAATNLHDWARTRILDTSILGRVDTLVPLPSVDGSNSAASEATTMVSGEATDMDVVVAPAGATFEPINILLMGTDARPDELGPPLTDTLILLSLDPNSMTAGILSLPRDLWVPLPGMDLTTKVNIAYRIGETSKYPGGGPQLVKDTISSVIGQPVPYYVQVSFDGFTEVVDLIGGVDVVVPVAIHDEEYPTENYGFETFHLDAGAQHMDGETALKYVRTRNVDSDYGRARRQQQVIRALADKVLRAEMIPTLIAKAPKLLYTMRSSIDTDMPMAVQLDLANFVADNSVNEIRQLVLDSRYGEETYSDEGAWILVPDRARVRAALNTFFSPAPSGNAGAVAAAGTPDWIRVEILNGTGEPGVAARRGICCRLVVGR